MRNSKQLSGGVAGASFIAIILIILLMFFSSCEKPNGCGIVKGGEVRIISDVVNYYLDVQFEGSSRTREVKVDFKTFMTFNVGDTVCFQ